jgi:hypothetical protein
MISRSSALDSYCLNAGVTARAGARVYLVRDNLLITPAQLFCHFANGRKHQ